MAEAQVPRLSRGIGPAAAAVSGDLSRVLGNLRLLGSHWLHVRVGQRRGYAMPAANHVVVHVVVSGTLHLQVGQQVVTLPAGATALLPQGRPHTLRVEDGAPTKPFLDFAEPESRDIPRIVTVGPTDEAPAAVVLSALLRFDWPEELPAVEVLPALLLGTQTYRSNHAAAIGATVALLQTAVTAGATACLSRFAELLLTRQLRDVLIAHPQLLTMRDATSAALMRTVEAVRTKPEHDWAVAQMARNAGMSRSTFAAEFKAAYGRAPMEFVADLRMEIAAGMLLASSARVKAIAARVGYTSITAFVRRFSTHFGVPPTVYRRRGKDPEVVAACVDWSALA